jgi:2-polyprenyl-6-methoxyphenol hydroxylase-like FAD-dependent oxidoreductase
LKMTEEGCQATVIVIGAGPVGLFVALLLGQAKISVQVVEKLEDISPAPRAVGYTEPVQFAFNDAGIYDRVKEEGFLMPGMCWRKRPVDDGKGGKRLGDELVSLALPPIRDGKTPPGSQILTLPQSKLCRILLDEALATGYVSVDWGNSVIGLSQNDDSITVTAKTKNNKSKSYTGRYVVGCDGGKSSVRKLLGVRLVGHTWPDRVVATDVRLTNREVPHLPIVFIVVPEHWALVTPLEPPVPETSTIWRYTIGTSVDQDLSDVEMLEPSRLAREFEILMAGPRPLEYTVERKSCYTMHQRLATTMRRGRCLLAGDAAHLNTVSNFNETLSIATLTKYNISASRRFGP